MDVNSNLAVKGVNVVSAPPPPRPVAQSARPVSVVKSQPQPQTGQPGDLSKFIENANANQSALSVSDKAVVAAIKHINKVVQGKNIQLQFSVHKETNVIMVKMIDSDTSEVVREIPAENILNMVAERMKMAGLYVDERR